jgi:hypothetical protein
LLCLSTCARPCASLAQGTSPRCCVQLERTLVLQAEVCEALCGEGVCAALGAPHAKALRMRLVDLAAAAEAGSKPSDAEQPQAEAKRAAAQQADRRLAQVQRPSHCKDRQYDVHSSCCSTPGYLPLHPQQDITYDDRIDDLMIQRCGMLTQRPRPKLELALPYGSYHLTRADGGPLERTDKHPFCMSRCARAAARSDLGPPRSVVPAQRKPSVGGAYHLIICYTAIISLQGVL